MLDKMDLARVPEDAEVWEKVVRKLRTGAMPPQGVPRPDEAMYDGFATWLETTIDQAAAVQPNPGRPPIHRLNRTEYSNAIRDLLNLEIDGRSFFPADDTGYGFDNIADVLSVSPMLLERYISAAKKISRLAVGDPLMMPESQTYVVGKYFRQIDRRSEDLPFGSRGGFAVRHYFPADGDYVIKVYLDRTYTGQVRGMAEQHQLEIRVNGEKVQQFMVGGVQYDDDGNPIPPRIVPRGQQADQAAQAGQQQAAQAGREQAERGGRGAAQQVTPEQAAEAAKRAAERAARAAEQAQIAGQRAEQSHDADAHLFVRFPAKAGPAVVAVTFMAKDTLHEGMRRHPLMITSYEYAGNTVGDPAVHSIDIRGPYDIKGRGDTPSRRQIFVCRPTGSEDEEGCADQILSTVARRAYRRPVTDADVKPLREFYKAARRDGDFDSGIEMALQRILVSPEFLFRAEDPAANVPPGTAYGLSDIQLASRLSFFLWSSIPDDELMDVASRGRLREPEVWEQQVRRMLADPRSIALVHNFAGQWLFLRNLRLVTPDPYEFVDFDDNLREAFQRETELFLEAQIREDRSVPELLTAEYTFLNQRLAEHYGIAGVYGGHFRRVTLIDDTRQGLLGQGSILTVTSYPNRTSPVVRGKFLLENILGTPPPPPPPNVPQLRENKPGDAETLSVRERLEQHRANPVCASCHRRMDPLGFALENFDAIGRYRTKDGNTIIDPSGVMPNGTKLDGPRSLRQALVAHPDEFVYTVTEKLLTYALGRGVEYFDAPAIRQIVRGSTADDYRWSSVILRITKSMPFQMRMSESLSTDSSRAPSAVQ